MLVVDKASGVIQQLEATPTFMWHALNAYERGNVVIADFVGSDAPDHFLGPDAAFT
ncbi:MAG: hypothetical protein EXQ91_08290 [Alphaproteobacteria bacterium]|nr:hypothetical protein [Alphaproteobacteria bacterium]